MSIAARFVLHRRRLLPSTFVRRPKFEPRLEHVRFVSRLHKHLSNNDIDGCWDVVEDPPKEFNFSRDIIDFWAAEKQKKSRGDMPAFWFAKETSSEPDIKYTFSDLSHLSQRNDWKLFDSLLRNSSSKHEGDTTSTDDPAIVFFTSGTTGPPKMVEHTQGYFLAHLSTACHVHSPEQHDMVWCIADPGWAKAAWGTFPTWLMGACFFQAQMPKFLSTATLAVLRDYPITKLCAPPTVYRALLQQDSSQFQFKSLVDCISAGEPMNPEVMLKWQDLTGVEIREVYGQTETVVLCASPRHHPIKPGSMGIPPRNIMLQIHDEKGREVAVGETGLIAVDVGQKRPFGLFAGYRDDPERTAIVFRNGFYYTGDRASMDIDGYFWFYSRADDVIISAGYRIGPFEVESVLIEHPAVVECAVVASPDPHRGEVVKAFVVLHPDYKSCDPNSLAEELQQHVKKHTAPYKYPRKVEFVDQLPKTISGKILRHLLREREKSAAAQC
ncbi:acyl-coenzyme A synthetase ACSM3, mitochondrial isoform X3 [Dermacentor silvarum]|uniref:acyl-coenzyme A synthetase ACSM3, mitochondrial isoform X3 n=1 Tax=Dermacentor silvarum TaxID=543639 RepID=UPI00210144B7|nr:acyl-coenzyme A synthetase ACSM3, mitochondrial isoform X3 [Dermacentor silvarum]